MQFMLHDEPVLSFDAVYRHWSYSLHHDPCSEYRQYFWITNATCWCVPCSRNCNEMKRIIQQAFEDLSVSKDKNLSWVEGILFRVTQYFFVPIVKLMIPHDHSSIQ